MSELSVGKPVTQESSIWKQSHVTFASFLIKNDVQPFG